MIRLSHVLRIVIFFAVFVPFICHAETARVLPKGVFSLDATYYHYFDITKRYNPDGDTEDLAVDYNRDLTSEIFPALAPLDALVGEANIGRSVVDFTRIYRWFEFALNYGITDNLTVGLLVPYSYSRHRVDAHLDTTNANIGKNPLYGSPSDPFGSPLVPIALGGVPLTTDDARSLLGDGLDVNNDGVPDTTGYGYERFDSWTDSGINDIEILGKYNFLNKSTWRLAATAGVRFPTGEVPDPDVLQDLGFGNGQTDLLFRLYADYVGIKNVLVNATIRYDLQLPDEEKLRVPDDVNRPLTENKETVDRNLGDIVELEIMGNYSFSEAFSGGLKYRYTTKMKDDVDGDMGFNYASLEDETDLTGHMFFVMLGYSTVQKYFDKKFPVPLSANLTYRNRFAGSNNATKSEYISFNLAVYF